MGTERSGGPRFVGPLRAWLVASHAAVFGLPVVVLLLTGALGADLRDQTREDIQHQATIVARTAEELAVGEGGLAAASGALGRILPDVRERTLAGLQVTDASGRVVASSGDTLGDDLSGDAVVQAALQGIDASSVRPRIPTRHPLSSESRRAGVRLFVAAPIWRGEQVIGAVVVSRTPREELQALYQMADLRSLVGAALGWLVAIGVGAWASVVLTRSLSRLDEGARRIAGGALDVSVLAGPSDSHVAEVARLSRSVTTMAERMQARIAWVGDFASSVSHEFKTPLATLRGTVELLADDDEMPLEQRERFLVNAERELDRLERLMNGLLSLARADEGPGGEPVDLDAVVVRCTSSRGLVGDGTFGTVAGDAAQLESVLGNLLDNALRHGGKGVTVAVRDLGADGPGFEVVDDGVGISPANLPRVFDRFFTTDRAEGTGLGLALVRAIVEAHGGTITVRSEPGRTVFRVGLPAYRSDA